MGSTILRPTGTLALSDGATIVGSAGPATVWADNTDTTYAVTPDVDGNHVVTTVDHFAGTGTVASVIIHARASAIADPDAFPTSSYVPRFQIHSTTDLFTPLAQGIGTTSYLNDGSINDFQVISDPIDDPAAIAAALAGDVYVEIYGTFEVLTIYEAWVEVVTASTGAPPLRRYPPVNNGGFGPTRHWPRTVNRRAGGTY